MSARLRHAPPLLLGWATVLLLGFYPMLFSGLALTPGDRGDARLIHYLLEHSYRWVLRYPAHRDLWSPPVFYPARNTAAYSDLLVSAGPFYWCWRGLGWPPDTAFQLWLLTMASLNFLTMYAFLARGLRFHGPPAALGAVLFAAANARVAEIYHPQLWVHFYTVVALYAVVRFFEAGALPAPGRLRLWAWAGVFSVAAVLQLYASYYLGWFLGLGLFVAAAVACARGETRRPLFAVLWRGLPPLLAWGAVGAALLFPLASHYLEAARELPPRDWSTVQWGLPMPQTWFLMDETSWVYGGLTFLHAHPGWGGCEELGIGFVTPALAAWGLWRNRRWPLAGVLLWTAVILVVVTTSIPPYITLWHVVFYGVPGATVIRAGYRVCLLLLIAVAVGITCFLRERKNAWVVAAVVAVCLLEQGRTPPTFSKEESRRSVQNVASRVPPGCKAFLYIRRGDSNWFSQVFDHVDAMWAQLETDTPTVNGYSGNTPPHWDLLYTRIQTPEARQALTDALADWSERNGLDPGDVAVVEGPADK